MNINATLFVEMIVFGSFVELTRRYIWPPILEIIDERQAQINQGIENAKEAALALESAKEDEQKLLKEAREKSKALILQAEQTSKELISEAREEGKLLREKHIDEAQSRIEQQINKEKEDLQTHTLSFVENVLQKVIVKLPDQPQLNTMIDQAIGEANGQD